MVSAWWVFSQIIPQSVCSRYGLTVGAKTAGVVRVLLLIFFPVAYPISKVIICCLFTWYLFKWSSSRKSAEAFFSPLFLDIFPLILFVCLYTLHYVNGRILFNILLLILFRSSTIISCFATDIHTKHKISISQESLIRMVVDDIKITPVCFDKFMKQFPSGLKFPMFKS